MKILSIDTSTEACSAALSIDDIIQVKFEIAPQQHSRLILEQCDQLLADAELKPTQLDAVAFGCGPGSFTGLRIAAGVTQGIAFGADLPIISISTLAAQAQKVALQHPECLYLPAIDARMKEIYWGFYLLNNGVVELQSTEQVSSANHVKTNLSKPIVGIGSGWRVYQETLEISLNSLEITKQYPENTPSAEEIAVLAADKLQRGEVHSPEEAIPVYLRNNVAKKSTKSN